MSLYPSVEALSADKMIQAQVGAPPPMIGAAPRQPQIGYAQPPNGYPQTMAMAPAGSLYSNLYREAGFEEYMGLSLREFQNNIQYVPSNRPLTVAEAGFKRAQISPGVQEVTLQKDPKGKVGISLKAINKGIFVACVWKDSSATRAGLRVGDQILQINGTNLAGLSSDAAMKVIAKDAPTSFSMVVRDRPFERIIVMVKDSSKHMGFVFKHGKITHIAKDTSAARNGLLTEHQILEVNGQNVIGLKDEDVADLLDKSGSPLTLTIMPCFVYDTMVKNLSSSVMKKHMDHSIPDI